MNKLSIVILTLSLSLILTNPTNADVYVSGELDIEVYGPLIAYAGPTDAAWGSSSVSAVPTWIHASWPTIDGAVWISNTYYIGDDDSPIGPETWRKFVKTFEIPWYAAPSDGEIVITADNAEAVYVNGTLVGSDGEVQGAWVDNQEWNTVLTYTISASILNTGNNTLEIIVRNYTGQNTPTANPTGVIYKMTIDYDVPGAVWVPIDIKPGSWPNAINLCSGGVIPVAIFSTDEFDATTIVPTSVTLAGADVAVRGKGKLLAHQEDVNGDGLIDLVVQVETEGLNPDEFVDTFALITAELEDGTTIWGYDEVLIVKDDCE